jgi:hypothetical protein
VTNEDEELFVEEVVVWRTLEVLELETADDEELLVVDVD